MNINEYLTQSTEIDARIEKLKEEKQNLNKIAYDEQLLTVEVGELAREIQNILSQKDSLHDVNIYCPYFEVDSKCSNIKMFVEYRKPKIEICLFDRTPSTCGVFNERIQVRIDQKTKTSDGKYLADYLKLKPSPYTPFKQHVEIPQDMQQKLVVNLDPNDECFKNPILRTAAVRCAKRREKRQKIEKNPENCEKTK